MKLISFSISGKASYGAVFDDTVVDLGSLHAGRYPTLRSAIAAGALDGVKDSGLGTARKVKLSDVTLLPPIPEPEKIICVGLNYRKHAAEAGMEVPEFPSVFLRASNTLVGHGAPMVLPK